MQLCWFWWFGTGVRHAQSKCFSFHYGSLESHSRSLLLMYIFFSSKFSRYLHCESRICRAARYINVPLYLIPARIDFLSLIFISIQHNGKWEQIEQWTGKPTHRSVHVPNSLKCGGWLWAFSSRISSLWVGQKAINKPSSGWPYVYVWVASCASENYRKTSANMHVGKQTVTTDWPWLFQPAADIKWKPWNTHMCMSGWGQCGVWCSVQDIFWLSGM